MTPNERLFQTVKDLDQKFSKDYMLAEVGTAAGTSAIWTMKALAENKSKRFFHTIDPYGGKPYNIAGAAHLGFDYDDDNFRKTQKLLKDFALENDINHTHWKMRSQDFVKMFPDINFWADGKIMDPKFCFAFLDGEHAYEPILEEFQFFYDRMPSGGVIIVDDYNLLGMDNEIIPRFAKFKGDLKLYDEDYNYRIYFVKE